MAELSDAECDEIIGRVTGMPGKQWPGYDHRLVRAGYRAGAARVGIAREPTQAMIDAACAKWNELPERTSWGATWEQVWIAMYDAAREQPPQREADTGGAATDGQPDSERA